MSEPLAIQILVVDDGLAVREGLTSLLNRQADMKVVAEASNGRQAIEQFALYRPDLVLMDVSMPEMGGVVATRLIVKEYPAALVIMYSNTDEAQGISLQAGAKAYVLKDSTRQHLFSTIRAVCSQLPNLPPASCST